MKAMKGVQRHLLRKSRPSYLTFIGEEKQSGEFYAKMVGYMVVNLPGKTAVQSFFLL